MKARAWKDPEEKEQVMGKLTPALEPIIREFHRIVCENNVVEYNTLIWGLNDITRKAGALMRVQNALLDEAQTLH